MEQVTPGQRLEGGDRKAEGREGTRQREWLVQRPWGEAWGRLPPAQAMRPQAQDPVGPSPRRTCPS